EPVVAGEALDREPVARSLRVEHVDPGREPCRGHAVRDRGNPHAVVAAGAVEGDLVGLAVACAAGGGEVGVDGVDVGAGEVVDGDGVGAAEGVDVDGFDAVGVHGDVGDVAGEAESGAVGGELDLFGDVGAVEEHGVGAGLAFDGVAAVAGVPLEG